MKKISLFITIIFSSSILPAQNLAGIFTQWSDSFAEWTFYTSEEEEGELNLRWSGGNNWTEWQYRLGEHTGQIRQKWANNPNEWEVRGDNKIASARTVWNNDFREWRVSDGKFTLTLKSRYGNIFDDWEIRSSNAGAFRMYTEWEGDPRSWVIADELDEEVSLPMKMAMMLVVIFNSSPKQ